MIFGPALTGDGEDFQTDDLPDGAINIALRKLGVLRGGSHDEFDAVGLGKHRDNESWIEEMTPAAPEIASASCTFDASILLAEGSRTKAS